MSSNLHYKKLEHMYEGAKCNEYYLPKMTITEGRAELIILVQEKFFHSGNAVHGSVYFKALDDVCFFAVNSIVEEVLVLTSSFNIYLLRPISEGDLKAVGTVAHATNSSFIAEGILYDSQGKELARGSGNFVKSKIKLTADMGYK
ncbi:MAG: PaaI family thioesterase [Acidobacteriota bacterium]